MAVHPAHAVTLTRHPESPAGAVTGIRARVVRNPEGILELGYVIEGEIDRLRVPLGRGPSGRVSCGRDARFADRLWEHTCCEVFIARAGRPAYHEFNFSPSGEWAVHAFERYRERGASVMAEAEAPAPRIAVRATAERLELDAGIQLDRLSPAHRDAALALAVTAVIEESDGALSYWALRHPPGRPDFHHADGYALELGANRASSVPHST